MIIRLGSSCPFNLDFTLCCGQTFRWIKSGKWWYGATGERVFKVRQLSNGLEFKNAEKGFVRHYFGLDDNLQKIFSEISKDEQIIKAIERFRGLRILRQHPWECLISYICATYKNIPAIRQVLFELAKKFGEKTCLDGQAFYSFPTANKLADASLAELTETGLGYRARYVSETAKMINTCEYDFESLKKATCQTAREELLKFPGVGQKVADCVLLFSLEKLEAFPVDRWIRRVVSKYYPNHFPRRFMDRMVSERTLSRSEYEMLRQFAREYFGQYAGYAQEYLYHYERTIR